MKTNIYKLIGNQDAIIDRLEIVVNQTKMSKRDKESIQLLICDLKAKNEEIFENVKV